MLEIAWSFAAQLGYLLLLTATLVFLTKRSFGKCLPLAMIFSAFLLFFSQLILGTFKVGFVVGVICALAAIIIGFLKRKEWAEFCSRYFTSGFWVFLTIYVLVFIYDFARGFSAWDEFSHWGMMVKEMVRLDKFYSVEASNLLVHKDYPPIMQLFELFWVKLCGGYKEAYLERAVHTFELSLLVPFIAEKVAEKKNAWKSVLVGMAAMFAIAFTIILFDQHGVFQTIYTDYAMALVVVWLMMTIYASKKISWFEIVTVMMGGGFLLLLKQMGLPLYLMVICFLIGIVWLRKDTKWRKYLGKLGWKKIVGVVVVLIVPLVIWWIWGHMVTDVNTPVQFSMSDLSVSEFVRVLMGEGEAWQSLTVKNYVTALGQENISTSWLQLSYAQGILAFVGALWLTWWGFRKSLNKKETMLLGGILVIGAVGYAVAMLILYAMAFGSYEGPELASFNRYMGTYLMIMLVTVVMVVIWQASEMQKRGIIYALTIGLAIVTAPEAYGRVYPALKYSVAPRFRQYELAAEALDEVVEDDAKVFLVVQDSASGAFFYLQYYATPIKVNYGFATWITGGTSEAYYRNSILPRMKEYDYLLTVNFDEKFEESYCSLIKVCPLEEWNLYKIIKNGSGEVKKYQLIDQLEFGA